MKRPRPSARAWNPIAWSPLLLAVLVVGAPPAAGAYGVTGVTVTPSTADGPCPLHLTVRFTVTEKPGARLHQTFWTSSQGTINMPSIELPPAGTAEFERTVDFPFPGRTERTFNGDFKVGVKTNVGYSSAPVRLSLRCVVSGPKLPPGALPGPGGGAGPLPRVTLVPVVPTVPAGGSGVPGGLTARVPDLVPVLTSPMSENVVVRNAGSGPAPASQLLVKISGPGGAELPRGAILGSPEPGTTFDPALGGLLYPVPPLAPGASHTVRLGFFRSARWQPGKYVFTTTADPMRTIPESSEANNSATSALVRP